MKLSKIMFGFVILIVGCSQVKSVYNLPNEERDKIISRTYKNNLQKVFNTYLKYLQSKGWTINVADRETGIITTGFKSGEGLANAMSNVNRKLTVSITSLGENLAKASITVIQEEGSGANRHRVIMFPVYVKPVLNDIFNDVKGSLNQIESY